MKPQQLIAAFNDLAEAPDGVARLRVLILQLAVRGRLVPQSSRDESGAALLAGIPAEMRKLAAAGLVRKVEPYPSVEVSQLGYGLPTGWSAAPLGNVALVLDHLREPVKAEERDARCAGKQADALYPYFGATQQQGWIDDYRLDGEFVLLGEDGVPFLDPLRHKAYLVSGRIWVNNHAHVLLGVSFSNAFLLHYLNQFDYTGRVTGTTRAKLTKGDLVDIPIPVPPLAEQHRIVARVKELMDLLDRLEAARVKRETTRAAARDSVLAALREADSPAEVDAAWTRFAERMDDLVYEPADIAPLRQTVLQLAVRGRLVPQDPRDQVASAFLGKREIAPAQKPFTLPSGWAWSCLGMLGRVVGGGTPSKSNSRYWDGAIPWVTPKDMKQDRIADSIDHITDSAIDGSAAKLIPPTALLMVVRGMILAHSFPTALTDVDVTINQDMKALVPFDGKLAPWLLILTKGSRDRVLDLVARSSHGTCKLKTDELLRLPLPIPPWTEQRRIVARVEEIMGLLDRLQARLTAGKTVHEAFAASAVHNLEPEELPMASTAQGAGRWHSG